MTGPLRIAYLGPAPCRAGGVAGVAGTVLGGLMELGHEVNCYVARLEAELPGALRDHPNFTLVDGGSAFRYDAWYSNTELTKMVSGYGTRLLAERRLAHELERRHAHSPYDVVYQFSHVELFDLDPARLPPLVVHPETHAAGELTWVRREHELAALCEPLYRRVATRSLLTARAALQRRHARVPTGFICPSAAFRRSFCEDCDVDPSRTRIVPNPIDLDLFHPRPNHASEAGPVTILFVGRISVRKGVECVVELSHRLADLAGSIELKVVGDRTQWSDYRRLLSRLEPKIASYLGSVPPDSVPELVRNADLLIQPSKYEPFGLTVGEALASGVPVVVTSAVGAAEGVSAECARIVPIDDSAALEHEVRTLVAELQQGAGPRTAAVARREAERLFRPIDVAQSVADVLEEFSRSAA